MTEEEQDFLAPGAFSRNIFPVLAPIPLTPEQRAGIEAFRHRQSELRRAGRLDDWDLEIGPTECPQYVEISDDYSQRCGLHRGHPGPHRVTFESL